MVNPKRPSGPGMMSICRTRKEAKAHQNHRIIPLPVIPQALTYTCSIAVMNSRAVRPAVYGTPLRYWEGCSSESGRWPPRPAAPVWTHCGPRSPGPGPPACNPARWRCCLPPQTECSWVHSHRAGSRNPQASPDWTSAC